jgi:hypothetical protein
MMVKKLINRVKIKVKKFFLKNSTNSPFISGDSIADCTDYYVFGKWNSEPLDLAKLSQAKSIFVSSHNLLKLFDEHFSAINASVLVTGNSDKNFEEPLNLPSSISLWLSQNNAIENDLRIFPLPIGLENKRLGRSGIESLHRIHKEFPVIDKILVPPMSPTNLIRNIVINHALNNPKLFDTKTKYLAEKKYFKLTRQYKFIFCCEGNGFENHRIWEILYQNSFPVMLQSKWSEKLKVLKLPILFVAKLEQLNQEMLLNFLEENKHFDSRSTPQLWVDFWQDLINSGDPEYVKIKLS